MVDVGGKPITERTAVAEGFVVMTSETRDRLFGGHLPKGDAVAVARVAGIMAAKRTSELIPLCHPLSISSVGIEIDPVERGVRVEATVHTTDRTGVEMEAMTAVSVAALTLYDMIKGIDRSATIADISLTSKAGGRSGTWSR